jgi:alpha-N-acetylglucosaminidase
LFHKLSDGWLRMMDLENTLLATNSCFLLGPWLNWVTPWAANEDELRRLQYDARSILTTWGDRTASEAGLHDYGNKDWAGLVSGYYRLRWQVYLQQLDESLQTGRDPGAIDWFQIGERWNRSMTQYAAQPHGDSWLEARRVVHELVIAGSAARGSDQEGSSAAAALSKTEDARGDSQSASSAHRR